MSSVLPPYRLPEADRTEHLCRRLAQRNFEVHLLTTRREGRRTIDGVEVHALMDTWGWRELPRLISFLSSCRPTAVFLLYFGPMYRCHPMITILGTLVRRYLPARTVFVVASGNLVGTFTGRYNRAKLLSRAVFVASRVVDRLLRRTRLSSDFGTLLATADHLILERQWQLDQLVERYPPLEPKAILLPTAPMIAKNASTESRTRGEVRDGLGIEPEAYVIAYFGFLYPYKRVDVLLDAFRLATDTDGGRRLLVIGDDLDPAHTGSASHRKLLQDRAERLGVNERIVWTGWLESEPAAEVLAVADVCVFPFAISLGNSSVGTVASHGIPVIAGWSAETESAFVHEENVYFYRPADDPKQLAKAIEALAKDRRLASRLQEGGLALHSDYFSWERTLGPIEWLLVSKERGGTGAGSVTRRSDGS